MLDVERDGGWVTLRLNRPEVGNALNGDVMALFRAELDRLRIDATVRGLVVTGAGKLFSAGADLAWMAKMKEASAEENLRDAEASGELFAAIRDFPRPVVAAVNGSARGGGVGLVAACDFAIASTKASFAFTEVRIGVIPALISPFVIARVGESRARKLFLTGETFSAEQAAAWGLVDRAVPPEELPVAVGELQRTLRQCAPGAMGKVKELLRRVREAAPEQVIQVTARMIADIRTSPEALEGMAAFLEKRPPRWAS